MSDALKGVTTIWGRLFDHRSFINGEIQFALREFEVKRGDNEVEKLFSIVENIANIKDTQINSTKQLIQSISPQIHIDLNQSLHAFKAINDIEFKYKEDISLEINREDRKLEWQMFVDKIGNECKDIHKKFEDKEQELVLFYKQLQDKIQLV